MSRPALGANRPDPIAYGRRVVPGLSINLLVSSVVASAEFQAEVFGAEIRYWEEHFAIMQAAGSTWLLHSDWSYRGHAFRSSIVGVQARGSGVELRLNGVDPDRAEARARARDAVVLSPATNQAHGQREVHIIDPDGYVWVPSVPFDGVD
jgi:uncharacterized glyoxalase superfamily protein PhnB